MMMMMMIMGRTSRRILLNLTLPAQVFVRMALASGRYVAQWRLPHRDIPIPPEFDIMKRAPILVEHCSQRGPHSVLRLSDTARGRFFSYQTYYNIKVKRARDQNDADGGAEHGIGPWKLGMLAACLFLSDIMWGDTGPAIGPVVKELEWEIQDDHVERAFKLASLLDKIRTAFRECVTPGDVESLTGPTIPDAPVDPERNLENIPVIDNVKTTEIARRMLSKATPAGDDGCLQVPAHRVFSLFTTKETDARKLGKVGVRVFRDIARACPDAIGQFNEEKDALTINGVTS